MAGNPGIRGLYADSRTPVECPDEDGVQSRVVRGTVPLGAPGDARAESHAVFSRQRCRDIQSRGGGLLIDNVQLVIAIEDCQQTILVRGRDQPPAVVRGDERGRRIDIPVMEVVLHDLVVGDQMAGVDIDREY